MLNLTSIEIASSSDKSRTHWDAIWSKEIPEKDQSVYVEGGSKLVAYNL